MITKVQKHTSGARTITICLFAHHAANCMCRKTEAAATPTNVAVAYPIMPISSAGTRLLRQPLAAAMPAAVVGPVSGAMEGVGQRGTHIWAAAARKQVQQATWRSGSSGVASQRHHGVRNPFKCQKNSPPMLALEARQDSLRVNPNSRSPARTIARCAAVPGERKQLKDWAENAKVTYMQAGS